MRFLCASSSSSKRAAGSSRNPGLMSRLHIGHLILAWDTPLTHRKQKMCPQSNLAGCTQLCKHTAHSKVFATAPAEVGTTELRKSSSSSSLLRVSESGDDLDAMAVFTRAYEPTTEGGSGKKSRTFPDSDSEF